MHNNVNKPLEPLEISSRRKTRKLWKGASFPFLITAFILWLIFAHRMQNALGGTTGLLVAAIISQV